MEISYPKSGLKLSEIFLSMMNIGRFTFTNKSVFDAVGIPASPHFLLLEVGNGCHILLAEFEVVNADVFLDAGGSLRFGEDDEIVLEAPSKAELSDGLVVLLADFLHGFAVEELVVVSCQGRVGFDRDALFSAEIDGGSLPEQRVDFELVHHWHHLAVLQQMLEVVFEEVADSDVLDFAFVL